LAAAALAWSPAAKSWVGGGAPGPGDIKIPALDGQLLTDPTTLAQAADDFGHIVHRSPIAVLVPGSVEDIARMVRFGHAHGIKVAAARGLGESHSCNGQSQVDGGVVIDMRALRTLHGISGHVADVDAGVRWIELLEAAVPLGKSPPTLTDYIDLSIGGTLSVGGIGGQIHHAGLQVDNVVSLDVVTGKGQLVTCSACENRDLFDAVRAGLGQFGIIVRARLRLVDVPPMARTYTAVYDDLGTYAADQLAAVDSGRFDYVEGSVNWAGTGWTYQIEAVKYFDPAHPPDDAALTAGLRPLPGTLAAADSTYFDFANRLAPTVAFLQSIGAWGLPHPWLDLFVPAPDVVSFVGQTLSQITPADTGGGPILLYAFPTAKVGAPFARVPDTSHAFLFSLLRFGAPPTPAVISAMMAQNRAIYDANAALGGKLYPVDAIDFGPDDWEEQLEPHYDAFLAAKARFDPHHVLTPGQNIF
jgi:FAD/FMN-containing dehydrogenase